MKKKFNKLQSKYDGLKKVFNSTVKINLEKDLKIQRLEAEKRLSIDGSCDSNGEESNLMYATYNQHFTPKELIELRSIHDDASCDATFIRTGLVHLYRDSLNILKEKSLLGSEAKKIKRKTKNGEMEIKTLSKEPLSPKKVQMLKGMLLERVSTVTKNEFQILQRTKEVRVNQLFANAIGNINRSRK